jgi:hypothetical protein
VSARPYALVDCALVDSGTFNQPRLIKCLKMGRLMNIR